jgi:spore coat polysaccharide biosynthesis predicted glycosyltransferase SpsG
MVADICNTQMAADLDQYSAYLDKLGRCVDCMVVIDDLTQIRFSASLVVNPNYGIDPNAYRVAPNTKLLLGPEFALFNKAFRMAAVAPKVLKNRVENVLVSMGAGRDIHGAVAKVLTALSSLPDNDLLTLRLVTGLDTSAHERYKNTLSTYKGRYTILANVRNMPELFTWADIAVVSGGLSKYEAALTGTPSLVIAQTEHEVDWMDKFESAETADYVGYAKDISVPMLIDALDHLNTDRQARETMSTRGKALVAGAGVHRIVGEVKALLRSE